MSPARPTVLPDFKDKPWPMRRAHITVPGAYVMYETDNKPKGWTACYRHDRSMPHPVLAPYWSDLLNRVKERTA